MVQKTIFSGIVSLFLLTWGLVIYEIFIKVEPTSKFATDVSLIIINNNKKNIDNDEFFNKDKNKDIGFRSKTEENKLMTPSLKDGIDFGAGISIDDLLESYGIVMNSN